MIIAVKHTEDLFTKPFQELGQGFNALSVLTLTTLLEDCPSFNG